MKRALEIKTGCRLHFGLVELCADAEYCHAGLGLALESPGYTIRVDFSRDQPLDVSSDEASIDEYVRRVRDARRISSQNHPVEIVEALPLHCGLGAGTQLGVAIAATSLLGDAQAKVGEWNQLPAGQDQWSELGLAQLSGRGKRSAIGLHAFLHGGFIVDRGRGRADERHFECQSHRLPASWRVILATPNAHCGASGENEVALMEQIASTPNPNAPAMLKLMDSIASLAATTNPDFNQFTIQLSEYMRLASSLFETVQGGTYNGETLSAVACTMKAAGASAVGQSSWGPTIFGFASDETAADEIVERFQAISPANECAIKISQPARHGATWREV